jgi:hypothetical protein
MKTLYESILDDEGVLISDTKNHVKNAEIPFYLLKQFEGKDLTKHRDEIMDILRNTPLPKLKPSVKEYEYVIHPDFIIIRDARSKNNYGWICYIRINDAFKYLTNVYNDTITVMIYKNYFNSNSLKSFLNKYKFNILGDIPELTFSI